MADIALKPCPKVYILETHRCRTPADTLHFIEGMKQKLDMKAFRDATDLDRIGLPVFTCYRVRPDQTQAWHTGKGFTAVQAQVSLSMEALERYCSEFRDEYRRRLLLDSYNGLKKKGMVVLDPDALILPQFSPYEPNSRIHWIGGYDLIGGVDILVPACAVYHPFHLDDQSPINTHTDGIASGNTMEEAVYHGLMEVVERDAWSIAKFSGYAGDAVSIENRPENHFLTVIVEKFNQAGIELVARDIRSDMGIPVIAVFSRDLEQQDMIPIDGFGAHLDPRVAMARALTETAATRALFIQKYGYRGLREDLPDYYFMDGPEEDFRFYAEGEIGLADMEIGYDEDLLVDIRKAAWILQSRGFERLIVVDLTRPDIGLPTVRVIVPGMEAFCFDRTRKGTRLYQGQSQGE